MEKTIKAAAVTECTIPECVYNRDARCQAVAVTVSPEEQPECRTMWSSNAHSTRKSDSAVVGACHATGCRHNRDYHCTANGIYIGYVDNIVACQSYSTD